MDDRIPETELHVYGAGLSPGESVLTEPPVYLHYNDQPETEPTYIADTEPPLPRDSTHHNPTGQQPTLTEYVENACPICHRIQDNVAEHLLTAHRDAVNEHLAKRREQIDRTEPDVDTAIEPNGPVMYGTVETDTPGENLDPSDPRECDGCGERMSRSYARVFAQEDNVLWCPDCKPRSERYSNDPTYGSETHTDPSKLTGSDNHRSSANEPTSWQRGQVS